MNISVFTKHIMYPAILLTIHTTVTISSVELTHKPNVATFVNYYLVTYDD